MPTLSELTRQPTGAYANGGTKTEPQDESSASRPTTASDLIEALKDINCAPLWAEMQRLNPAAPNPTTVPFKWEYDRIRPYLLSAGDLITEKQAERRVLITSAYTDLAAPFTTDTLYAGLQLVQPRETAPAHRHAAFAVRFIIEGQGGFTAVQGRRVQMRPRDVLVTPTWNWHDHGKRGPEEGGDDKPVIWLDGLDLPTFAHFPVHFNEHYSEARYPAEDANTSPIVFPWEDMEAKLNATQAPWTSAPYLKSDGREVSRVIGSSAERLDAGSQSPTRLETASSVYHVIQGTGYTVINGTRISWKTGDTFCIPSWHQYQSFASDEGTVHLYRFDDKPMLKALGLYRYEGQDDSSLISD